MSSLFRYLMGQQPGKELPVELKEQYSCLIGKTIWSVHAGTRKSDNAAVTVFLFSFTNRSEDEIKLARSAHLRLKTLKHPNILRYLDGIETPDSIYMITEEATPLELHLQTEEGRSHFLISWGLHQIIKSISFLNIDCSLVHHNLCLSSVFIDAAGEWKLGGVEFMHQFSDMPPPKLLTTQRRYDPPESGTSRRVEKWSTDMWGLGCLVWEVFNGSLPQGSALKTVAKIPKPLISHYCEMVGANPRSRPQPSSLLESLRNHGSYLSNQFVAFNLQLEEVQIMESSQRNELFVELNKSMHLFPDSFCKHKILPQLLNAFEFGGAGSAVLAPLFRMGKLLDETEYQKKIVPCVVKLFSSNDRATRLKLLQQLEHFIDHLHPNTVNDQIFPHVASGFTDTIPLLREQTIKSMLLIAPKLSGATLNNQLLKCFAKCQLDEQAGIRTNTTICLGKIACHLNPKTRHKVLVSAFTRALKDPFPPARNAGISGLAVTQSYYSPDDIASRVLPALCCMTVDKEKSVRQQAFQVIKLYLESLEKHSENVMPDSAQQESGGAGSSAASWTGWAVSSLASKLYSTTGKNLSDVVMADASSTTSTENKPAGEPRGTAIAGRYQPTTDKGMEPSDVQPGSQARQDERKELSTDDWGSDQWEDFDDPVAQPSTRGQESSSKDVDGWDDDDAWEDFDSIPAAPVTHRTASPMKLQPRNPTPDIFDDGTSFTDRAAKDREQKRECTPPPPVPASMFAMQGEGAGGDDGWGDWEDTSFGNHSSMTREKHPLIKSGSKKEVPVFTMVGSGESDGWDFDSGWEPLDTPNPPSSATQSKRPLSSASTVGTASRQEMLQKRREERKQRQQAAREKRSTGMSLKPSGLGAVKKATE